MIPGMNPRQMQQMMKRMGIKQQEIDATEVIIRTPEKEIYINNPQVSKVNMMGQETFQIVGEPVEKEISNVVEINEEDIRTVVEQANVSEEEAKKAIEDAAGDLAQAIINLQE